MAGAVYKIAAFTNRGAWAGPGTVYAVKDLVSNSGTWYVCVVAHTSSAASQVLVLAIVSRPFPIIGATLEHQFVVLASAMPAPGPWWRPRCGRGPNQQRAAHQAVVRIRARDADEAGMPLTWTTITARCSAPRAEAICRAV